jgi:hypothetical protein
MSPYQRTFFEPPGSNHLVSENASASEPASLLAIFIAEDGAVLTKPGKERSDLPMAEALHRCRGASFLCVPNCGRKKKVQP